jgi:hypothetical protein
MTAIGAFDPVTAGPTSGPRMAPAADALLARLKARCGTVKTRPRSRSIATARRAVPRAMPNSCTS